MSKTTLRKNAGFRHLGLMLLGFTTLLVSTVGWQAGPELDFKTKPPKVKAGLDSKTQRSPAETGQRQTLSCAFSPISV